jgi:hypothetical protein
VLSRAFAAVFISAFAAGCSCGPLPEPLDAGSEVPDAGKKPKFDAGTLLPPPDAGIVFTGNQAGEKCLPETYGPPDRDGGEPDMIFGLCIAVNEVSGTAQLNDLPAASPIQLKFQAAAYQSEIVTPTDNFGRYAAKALRSRYDIFKYHPTGIFPTHDGPEEFGLLDLTSKDQQRDLKVRSHELRGSALFGNLPFTPTAAPGDITLFASGYPAEQTVAVTSQGGSYQTSLLEGTFQVNLSSPPTALMGTELIRYPLTSFLNLTRSSGLDISINTSELDGNVTIDGAPIPDRKVGTDFQLDFIPVNGTEVIASTHHEGGVMGFTSLLPKDRYSVMLRFESQPDRHLPSMIFNKQIAQQIDLTNNASLNVNLPTFVVEGGILVDGMPPPPNPTGSYTMFWYGWSGSTAPASLLYYELPLDNAAFSLNVFPSEYSVFLWVTEVFGPDFAEGWVLLRRSIDVNSNTQMPINIETALFEGKLFIDGQAPPQGQPAGELRFSSRIQGQEGTYWRTVTPSTTDGTFKVRLPVGKYKVDFAIDRRTYPEHASGWSLIFSTLDLTVHQPQADVRYDTVSMTGPLRVGKAIVDDNLPGSEVGLYLQRRRDGLWYQWDFPGGTPDYKMRLPEGDWTLHARIFEGAIPGVAWGEAPMGVTVPAYKRVPPPPPPQR